jgi:PPM family protein phosphatase
MLAETLPVMETGDNSISGGSSANNRSISYIVSAHSDIGLCRGENQDSFITIENEFYRVYAVADGMGGAKGGLLASKIAVNTFKSFLSDKLFVNEHDLKEAIEIANARIHNKAANDISLVGMGTTISVLAFCEDKVMLANVGDSRVYLFRNGSIRQLTEDHTVIAECFKAGLLDKAQCLNSDFSHVLTRSLGPFANIVADNCTSDIIPQDGDTFLVCSDGIYNCISEEEIVAILKNNHDSEFQNSQKAKKLIDRANQNGGIDNITAICVTIRENKDKEITGHYDEIKRDIQGAKVISVQQSHIRDSREGKKRSLLEVNEHFRPTDNKVDGVDERLPKVYRAQEEKLHRASQAQAFETRHNTRYSEAHDEDMQYDRPQQTKGQASGERLRSRDVLLYMVEPSQTIEGSGLSEGKKNTHTERILSNEEVPRVQSENLRRVRHLQDELHSTKLTDGTSQKRSNERIERGSLFKVSHNRSNKEVMENISIVSKSSSHPPMGQMLTGNVDVSAQEEAEIDPQNRSEKSEDLTRGYDAFVQKEEKLFLDTYSPLLSLVICILGAVGSFAAVVYFLG